MEMKKAVVNIFVSTGLYASNWVNFLSDWFTGLVSIIAGIIWSIFKKYLIKDVSFIPWLLIMVAADTWAGWKAASKKHKENPELHPKPTMATLKEKLAGKMTSITIILVVLNGLTNFELNGQPAQMSFIDVQLLGLSFDLNVFKSIWFAGCLSLIAMEARSAIRNVNESGTRFANTKLNEWLNRLVGKDAV